jgi:MFS transporter, DHA1 family, inner membrane transport protein
LILIFLAMPFVELTVVPAVIMIFVWGCVHFATGSPLQARIVDQAKGAPNLASTLNQGAFNLGNAIGASLGGIMLTEGIGYRYLSWGSAAVASVALLVALIALRVEQNEQKNHMVPV